jgi:RNA polymerase sigma factor (sigma-70 family)
MTYGQLYEEHAAAVYRCLLAWSRNATVAEDLTAETFYRALIAEQPVREATARGYFVAIARNLWLRHRQRSVRETALEFETGTPATSEAGEDLRRILEALHALPAELREPLILYAQGGLRYEEIAQQLNLTLATVKIRIFRARQRLEEFR